MKHLPLILALLLVPASVAITAWGQPADVYPPLNTGNASLRVQVGASDPTAVDTQSIGVWQNDGTADTLLKCAPSVNPGQLIEFQSIPMTPPSGRSTLKIWARAYNQRDCTGTNVSDSANFGYVTFAGPRPPSLATGSTPADVVIP